MNTHESFEELLALRLYDELDPSENARLSAHLEECAACRARAVELETSLGRLRGESAEAQFTAAARTRLEAALSSERRARFRPLPAAVLGFAAGVLCALGLVLAARSGPEVLTQLHVAQPTTEFARATPPPKALDRGLAELLSARQR